MKFYIGNTDYNWFTYLRKIKPEDVNFWQPGGTTNFKAIPKGFPFLFKLKRPHNAIAGVGFFVKHTILPLSVAWEAFGERNGCGSPMQLTQMINNYRKENIPNPQIGCIVLTNPIFFDHEDWLPLPKNWKKNIVQGKTYDSKEAAGKEVWDQVEKKLQKYNEGFGESTPKSPLAGEEIPEGFNQILQKVRVGQGAFRVMVTDAYQRRCSITGEKTLPTLEASHIKPYSRSGPHKLQNGILLRSDIHRLFDSGYLTITPDHKVEVSQRIHEEFRNGREYYKYHGKNLQILPEENFDRPNSQFIEWHNEHIYQG